MKSIWDFSDAMIFAMVFPNMIGLFFLFPAVKRELTRYLKAIKKQEWLPYNEILHLLFTPTTIGGCPIDPNNHFFRIDAGFKEVISFRITQN